MLRVFAKLLDNALKFTDRRGSVVLRAEADSAKVQFCVANSGPALSVAELESMFKPFWQAGQEDRRGAGLGLSICRSIIEAHGGTIWAEPEPGKRVRICFALPLLGSARSSCSLTRMRSHDWSGTARDTTNPAPRSSPRRRDEAIRAAVSLPCSTAAGAAKRGR
jgi:hypothetical protein